MLSGYSFENYKAFKKGSIEIKPITVFIGGNSSGKSSVSHLPLLLYQTANAAFLSGYTKERGRTIEPNGPYVSCGDPLSLISRRDDSKPLVINLKIKTNGILNKRLSNIEEQFRSAMWENFRIYYSVLRDRLPEDGMEQLGLSGLLTDKTLSKDRQRHLLIRFFEYAKQYVPDMEGDEEPDSLMFQRYSAKQRRFVHRQDIKASEDYEWSFNLIGRLADIKDKELESEIYLAYESTSRDLVLQKLTIRINGNDAIVLDFDKDTRELTELSLPMFRDQPIDRYLPSIKKMFNFRGSMFDFIVRVRYLSNDPLFPQILNQVLSEMFDILRESFNKGKFNFVGPLRDYPRKYYVRWLLSGGGAVQIQESISEILEGNPTLLEKTNKWLTNFATKISIKEHVENILQIRAIRNDDDQNLDISDVGFGVSQILPVVVQCFLSSPGSVTVIEQPEIHLHPNMQSKLADLFVGVVKGEGGNHGNDRRLIIETHSVPLLIRLRLRYAEKKLTKDDLAIYRFHVDNGNNGTIEEVPLEEGDFGWPEDFIEEELNDQIKYARIALGIKR